jgi:hypothetical protein
MKKSLVLVLLMVIARFNPLFAWGNKGHIVVIQVAKNQLHQSTIDSINFYLNGMQWETASIWMNDVKKSGNYDYMLPWHTIILPRDRTYVSTESPNVMNRIEYCLSVIKSRALYPRQEVTNAIMVLIHLVGDLHEPLNCGYPEDKGGKRAEVDFFGRKTSLYKVWETEIIDVKNIDQWDGAQINLALTKKEIANMKYGNIRDWMDESRSILDSVYAFKDGTISNEYLAKNKIVISKQLVKAGMRLANLLSSCFKVGSRATF